MKSSMPMAMPLMLPSRHTIKHPLQIPLRARPAISHRTTSLARHTVRTTASPCIRLTSSAESILRTLRSNAARQPAPSSHRTPILAALLRTARTWRVVVRIHIRCSRDGRKELRGQRTLPAIVCLFISDEFRIAWVEADVAHFGATLTAAMLIEIDVGAAHGVPFVIGPADDGVGVAFDVADVVEALSREALRVSFDEGRVFVFVLGADVDAHAALVHANACAFSRSCLGVAAVAGCEGDVERVVCEGYGHVAA